MIKIYINNKVVFVPKDITILQACELAQVEIPRFCYHEKLSVAGNCRMCLVEIEKSPKPVVACAMPIMPDMSIFTNTPLVKKAREAVLEFLLINHPLDCPICDQGGECDLQDNALVHGSDRSRYFEYKRGVEDKNCGPIVKTVMTRCIHCTRCVRFLTEVAGLEDFGVIGRGEKAEIGTYINKFIKTELSGNIVDLCPVGALTSKPYAFIARNWELKKINSIDYFDALGSNIVVHTRNVSLLPKDISEESNITTLSDEIVRILPRLNENLNEEWLSDKSRYAFDGLKYQRLLNPVSLEDGILKNSNWNDFLLNILYYLNTNIKKNFINKKYKNLIALSGPLSDIESSYYLFQFLNLFGSNNFQCEEELYDFNVDIPLFYRFNSKIKNIEKSDVILLIGLNVRNESILVNTRIRSQILKKEIKVGLIGNPVDLTYSYNHLGNSTKTLIDLVEGRHSFCKILRNSKNPIIIIGTEFLKRKDAKALLNLTRSLALFSFCANNQYNILHSNIGQINACELGLKPGIRSSLYINDIKFKKNELLFLSGIDITKNKWFLDYNSSKKNTKIFYQNSHMPQLNKMYNFLIPSTAIYEKTSFLYNTEGLVQKAAKAVSTKGLSRNSSDFFKVLVKLIDTNNTNFLNKSLLRENPMLENVNKYCDTFNFNYLQYFENGNKVYFSIFLPLINNFYMSDIISKNSQVMSECTLFLQYRTNFIKIIKN